MKIAMRSLLALSASGLGAFTFTPLAAQEARSPEYVDATRVNVPLDPWLHALDATFVDVDKDGDLDVVVAVEYGVNRLYLNDGHGTLTWKKGAFGNIVHDSEHVEAADLNGDGWMDLVFVAEDDGVHQLFLGGPGGTFTDASDRLPSHSEGNALAIGDVNGDGLPDIVIGNTNEKGAGSAKDFLWLNDADNPGHFIDASVSHLPGNAQGTQGIVLADMNGDGALDIVTAQQDGPNRLLLNDGTGHFTEATDRLEQDVPTETREVHVFDANGNGLPDILYFNLTSNNHGWDKDPQTRLLLNDGKGHWRDATKGNLPEHRFSSWGGEIVDFNHDGAPDIVVSAIQVPGFVPLQVRAWQNDGKGHFTDVTLAMMPSETTGRSWSMAKSDLDGDGKDDLFIGQWGTQARLLLTNRDTVKKAPFPKLGQPAS
ncbi:FG-GAP repeat domain-containing protein [Novosphingobium decolorationis]|uniref:VCBS repeat-containing protein n=1 Tax=Novosphingobium decolorationis TaxID=2698673 RepID=A0ABX8DZU5_9SPHN|nr:VCBS repeat-containing protein [Novosphingobium decolorationis]QVM82397.1 VCBS repeat-containing protein [Novosphingobium decolorationis]